MTMRESQVRGGTNKERTMREKCIDAHPVEDNPTNRTPMPFNWARDVDKSNGVSQVVSMDTRPTKYVDEVMISLPVAYDPCDLSALWSGT